MKNKFANILTSTDSAPAPVLVGAACPWDKILLGKYLIDNASTKVSLSVAPSDLQGCATLAVLFGFVFALRNSEVLSLTMANVLKDGSIALRAKKGGRGTRLMLPNHCLLPAALSTFPKDARLFPTNYHCCYRVARQLGLRVLLPGHERGTATHLGRHMLASDLMAHKLGDIVGDCLTHRSEQSQLWYKMEVDLKKDRDRKRLLRSRNK